MNKLFRFLLLVVAFSASALLIYCILPSIVWVLGGSFTDVSQHPVYVIFFLFLAVPSIGFLFSECFDQDFYSKN